jgi:homoserine kinase
VTVTVPAVPRDASSTSSPAGTLVASFALEGELSQPVIERAGELRALGVSDDDDFLIIGFRAACAQAGLVAPARLHCRAVSSIPVGTGQGASTAAIVAGAVGARGLLDLPLDDAAIAHVVADVDGSPAQVASAIALHTMRALATCDDDPPYDGPRPERGER